MHTCEIGPTDHVSLTQIARLLSGQGRTFWGRHPFCLHFFIPYSPVRLHSPTSIHDYIIRLVHNVDDQPRLFSLPIARCVATNTGGGWRGSVFGVGYGGNWLSLPLWPHLYLVAHNQSDKVSYLVPSFDIFQHDWGQTVWCKRLLTQLLQGGHCLLLEPMECQTLKQGVPGLIMSLFITIGTFRAPHKLHAKQVHAERPMARHYLCYLKIHQPMASSKPWLEVTYYQTGPLSFQASKQLFFPFMECDLPFITLDPQCHSMPRLIWYVALYTFLHISATNSTGGIPTSTQTAFVETMR